MADNSFIDNSGFVISERHLIRQTTFEGKTSQGLVVEENGKQFFLKRLREEYLDTNDYRTLFRKEFGFLGQGRCTWYRPLKWTRSTTGNQPHISPSKNHSESVFH